MDFSDLEDIEWGAGGAAAHGQLGAGSRNGVRSNGRQRRERGGRSLGALDRGRRIGQLRD